MGISRLWLSATLYIEFYVSPFVQTQETYPQPISESVEKTGSNSIAFLSYPKYYCAASGNLKEVITDLVPSTDPAWDYEVTKGIWQLKVKRDGTFQAAHEGDVFTYRFSTLGLGRGSGYRPLNLGAPISVISAWWET